jgi:Cu/Ag efflux protein CusF
MPTRRPILTLAALVMALFVALAQATETPMTLGVVKKVDAETGKVTIQHGEIQHLDMPGMTMVFTVNNKALLAHLKPGEKVNFSVVSEAGKLLIIDIQPAR